MRSTLLKPLFIAPLLFSAYFGGAGVRDAAAQEEEAGGWSDDGGGAAAIAQIDATGLSVALEQESDSNFLITIDLQGASLPGEKRPQVFTIANPTRLVVDLPGVQSGSGASTPEHGDIVSGLRLGAHAEKVRLVVDLTTDEVPTYRVKREGSFVLVRFSVAAGELPPPFEDGDEIQPVKVKEPEPKPTHVPLAVAESAPVKASPPKVTPTDTPVVEEVEATEAVKLPTPGVGSAVLAANDGKPPVPEPISADQLSGVPTAASDTVVPAPSDGKTVVRGIYYQTTSNSQVPAVVFDASGLATYSLNKQKADVYELVLKNSSLGGRHLTLPQFPPDSFQGFNVIVARQQGNDVVIKVYVEENVKLFPFIAKQQLWLKASR